MQIEVQCPQGHRITCPADWAGQTAKCPKCGATFQIPNPNAATAAGDSVIAFLCPNGHKLTGPASLQGKPGQCPHCHSKFVIPDYSQDESVPAPDAGRDTGLDALTDSPIPALEDLQPIDDIPTLGTLPHESAVRYHGTGDAALVPQTIGSMPQTISSMQSVDLETGIAFGAHPMAELFEQLWRLRDKNRPVDVHLKGGDILRPDRYSARSQQQDQVLFAVKESNGSYTLAAVPWDAVARISIGGVKELPTELFGS